MIYLEQIAHAEFEPKGWGPYRELSRVINLLAVACRSLESQIISSWSLPLSRHSEVAASR